MATESNNYVLGRGECWFGKFKPGTTTPDGFRFLGNVPDFTIGVQSEKMEHFRSTRGIKEKDLVIVTSVNRSSKIVTEDVSPENLALFFLGSDGVASQAAVADLTETFTDVVLGRLYQVGLSDAAPAGLHSLVTPVLKKGVTTLVADTDYTIDVARGTFTLLESGTVVDDGDDVVIEYDVAAKNRSQVISGQSTAEGALKFLAYPANGDPVDYYMPFVEISSDGDLSLIGDELMKVPLSVDIQTNGSQEAIYANGAPYSGS